MSKNLWKNPWKDIASNPGSIYSNFSTEVY